MMRIRLLFLFLTVLALSAAFAQPARAADNSLGGLVIGDKIPKILSTFGTPDMIRARRMPDESDDYAMFVYQKSGLTIVTLTAKGDALDTVLTDSSGKTTNDGIKVGDPVATVTSKRGQPEETGHEVAGITEYWYWSQGINFGIDDAGKTVKNILIFPPTKPGAQQNQSQSSSSGDTQTLSLPKNQMEVQHHYMSGGGKAYISGSIHNIATETLHGVHLGLMLMDKNGRVVKVVPVEAGSLLRNSSIPFKVAVPPKGSWTSYRVDMQASQSDASKARIVRVKYAWKTR